MTVSKNMVYFWEIIKKTGKIKLALMAVNVLSVFFLVLLSNLKILPLKTGDFVFFSILILAFSLYRPGWSFLLLIGTVILENVNLAPENFGFNLRPYQWLSVGIAASLLIRKLKNRLGFSFPRWRWFDFFPVIIFLGSLGGIINAPDKILSLKLSLVAVSFSLIYYLTRIFIQDGKDLKRIVPFFASSSIILLFYGIWQNWRFARDLTSFEAMPGRPNGTFPEADWLGMFLIVLAAAAFSRLYLYFQKKNEPEEKTDGCRLTVIGLFLTSIFVLLVIAVSRSAWLGTSAAAGMFLFLAFTDLKINPKKWRPKLFFHLSVVLSVALALSAAAIYIFHLTDFQLGNRLQSSGSGLQKITIACEEKTELPEKIRDVSELSAYRCRHVNLEEIDSERNQGKIIREIYRLDPNFNIRAEIYRKAGEQIKKHWFSGIGWGSIGKILGPDARGADFNASNFFLEIWLGSGLLGFLSFMIFWGYVFFRAIGKFFRAEDSEEKAVFLFILASWIGLSAANLFNSGVFLGFFWVFLAAAVLNFEKKYENRD